MEPCLHTRFALLAATLDRAKGIEDTWFQWQKLYARDVAFVISEFQAMDRDLKKLVASDMERAAREKFIDVSVLEGTPYRVIPPDEMVIEDPKDGAARQWGAASVLSLAGVPARVPARVLGFVRYPGNHHVVVLSSTRRDEVYQLPLEWVDALVEAQKVKDGSAEGG